MSSSVPTRIDSELFEAAKPVGEVSSRSAAQQINHWARIGREMENSPGTSQSDIQRVLAGLPGITYDDLSIRDQAIVRANWDERMANRCSRLNYAELFESEGQTWSEADEHGNVVVRSASQPEQ